MHDQARCNNHHYKESFSKSPPCRHGVKCRHCAVMKLQRAHTASEKKKFAQFCSCRRIQLRGVRLFLPAVFHPAIQIQVLDDGAEA